MGNILLWRLSHNQLFSLFFFSFFLYFFQVTTSMRAQLCGQEQSSALLQFRGHFSFSKSASSYQCDGYGIPSYPKLRSWKEGTDCCSWDGVECDISNNETRGHVIGLDLSCSWLQGSIHSNSTLFHYFPLIRRLNLAFNDFSKSRISSAFGRFSRLTHLNLSDSSFSGQVPLEVSFLTKLVTLDLSRNVDLRLEKPGFELLVQNLTRIRELNLALVNIPSVVSSSLLNLSTSLMNLNLRGCGFHGKFPDGIFQLPHLNELDIGNNDALTGHFPRFINSSSQLQYLDLGLTSFSGELPHSFGNLKSLKYLFASDCKFYGSIPTSLGNLTQIIVLGLSSNNLSGTIADFLPNGKNLAYLLLYGNNFSGPLFPSLVSNLTELVYLDVSYNHLTSPLPSQMTQLPNLSWFFLDNNLISGAIPYWVFSLPALEDLDISYNKFTGHINEFQYSSSLVFLYLSHNNIEGAIPSSIFELENLMYLFLSSNNFSGPLPSQIIGLPSLSLLDLGDNLITGAIPAWVFSLPALQFLLLGYNKFTGHINEFHSTSLGIIDLSHNFLGGAIPSSIFELKNLTVLILASNNFSGSVELDKLCNAMSLEILDLSSNRFSGALPQPWGNFSQNLSVLDLRKNNFSDTIPDTFARGNNLKTINLNGNRFEGSVPKSLVNCTKLEVLDLGNNKFSDKFPHWLENLPNLHILILRSNNFYGPMAASKTKYPFPNLRVIDMSDNYFNGPLPKKYFKYFKAMMNVDEANFQLEYMGSRSYYNDSLTIVYKGTTIEMVKIVTIFTAIDLSKNKFEGEIPDIIGNLNSIRGLNLSHNSLTGYIPESLGNSMKLEWLDLSSNKLTGNIPQQLTNLKSLGVLNLSQNQLIGQIPQGNQFDTFSNDSYIDNLALCGPPLSNTCSNTWEPQPPPLMFQQEDDSESLIGWDWEVILPGYGCGLVIGLVMGYLMFSVGRPQWLVRIIEGERYKSGKRLKRHAQRHRGGRQ